MSDDTKTMIKVVLAAVAFLVVLIGLMWVVDVAVIKPATRDLPLVTTEYNGHTYVGTRSTNRFIHDPDCVCGAGE